MQAETLPGRLRTGLTRADRIDSYLRVIYALMLRDMRTRFLGSHWGYLIQVLWPVAHVMLIATAMTIRGLPAPILESTMLFVATGIVPALAFNYMSRQIMNGLLANKPLTYFPQVKIFDLMISRILVELCSNSMGLVIIFCILTTVGIDPFPVDIPQALGGYACALFLGIGMGTINVAIVSFFPGWAIGYMLFWICMYISSCVILLPHYFPDRIYDILKWNPLMQIVEWVRLGYEPTMPITIDYTYILLWCGTLLLIGLVLERTVVRRL